MTVVREDIEEGVGSAVIHLAKATENRAARRAGHEEVKRRLMEERGQHQSSFYFRGHNLLGHLRSFQLDDAAARHACRMDYAVHCSKTLLRCCNGSAHLLFITYVRAQDQYFRAHVFQALKLADFCAD